MSIDPRDDVSVRCISYSDWMDRYTSVEYRGYKLHVRTDRFPFHKRPIRYNYCEGLKVEHRPLKSQVLLNEDSVVWMSHNDIKSVIDTRILLKESALQHGIETDI